MDVRQLRYFLAIVDQGGFGRAADSLLVAQPSLSQAMASLERDLGVDLFQRIGRRALLSPAGEQLVFHARLVLRNLDAARAAMDAVLGLRSGRVDLVTMPSPGIEPLTSMIATFTTAHPDVSVNVAAAFTADEVIGAVRSGAAEIGVLGTSEPRRVGGLRSLQLDVQPLVLIVAPGMDVSPDGDSIRVADLAGCRLVVSQRGSLMRWMVDDAIARGVDIRIAVEVAHRTSILPLVLRGVGHAVMPSSWATLAAEVGLRTLRIDGAPSLHVAAVRRPDQLSAAAMSFLEVAEAYARRANT